MADNVQITAGSGTTVAADDVGGVLYPRAKMCLGADGAANDAVGGAGAVSAAVQRVTLASDDPAVAQLTKAVSCEYETVAKSQTAQVLGPTGALGDWIKGILVIPETTSPGNILLLDDATSITVFTGGTVSDIKPFFIELGMVSVSGAWKITTGDNVHCVAVGQFT